jgi:hypothetical protein
MSISESRPYSWYASNARSDHPYKAAKKTPEWDVLYEKVTKEDADARAIVARRATAIAFQIQKLSGKTPSKESRVDLRSGKDMPLEKMLSRLDSEAIKTIAI